MSVICSASVLIILGLIFILGKKNKSSKYKLSKEQEREYSRKGGLALILIGVTWLILGIAKLQYDFGSIKTIIMMLVLAIPGFSYALYVDHQYKNK